MQRVVVLGRGGAGKTTLAIRLGEITRLPVVELDKRFWQPGLVAPSRRRWVQLQRELVAGRTWIMDGDLGPYDVVEVRLAAADTVIVLDFPFAICAWRAIRRSRERADFWRWVWAYRHRSLPRLQHAITVHAPDARLHILHDPRAVRRFLTHTATRPPP